MSGDSHLEGEDEDLLEPPTMGVLAPVIPQTEGTLAPVSPEGISTGDPAPGGIPSPESDSPADSIGPLGFGALGFSAVPESRVSSDASTFPLSANAAESLRRSREHCTRYDCRVHRVYKPSW